MSQKWFNGLNLQQNQLENAVIQNLASDPSSGKAGQIYYNTTDNGYRYYNGTAWVSISADAIKSIVAGNGLTSSTSGNAVTLTLGTPSTSGAASGNTFGDNNVTENSHTHQIRIPSASTIEKGIVQLATDTEATTGTETTKAVTPKQLASAKQDAINSAKVTIQTSDGLTGGSSTPATSFTLGLSDSGVAAGTYNNVTVDAKGRVTAGSSQEYATKTYVNTQDDKKLDKAGGIITGDLTIGGNVTVNGTTTTVNSNTLTVKDKLIEVAKDNTTTLTSPAGIIVPKYNGTDYGALVIDSDGNAKVGDVKLTAGGDIDVNNSDLQTLATRDGLQDGQLVKWDDTKKTLVPDTTVASNASSALSTANANATEITNIKNGTTTVGKAASADTAGKVAHDFMLAAGEGYYPTKYAYPISYNGGAYATLIFDIQDFGYYYAVEPSAGYKLHLTRTGVEEGTYNRVTVDGKGRVTAASNESYATKVVQTITGDGSKTSFDVAHTLGTDVSVQVYLKNQTVGADTVDELVMVDTYTLNNKVKLLFATAPTTTQTFKVVIIG